MTWMKRPLSLCAALGIALGLLFSGNTMTVQASEDPTTTIGGVEVDLSKDAGGEGWSWAAETGTLTLDEAYPSDKEIYLACAPGDTIDLVFSGDISMEPPSETGFAKGFLHCKGNLTINSTDDGLLEITTNSLYYAIRVMGDCSIGSGRLQLNAQVGFSPISVVGCLTIQGDAELAAKGINSIYSIGMLSILENASVSMEAIGGPEQHGLLSEAGISIDTTGKVEVTGYNAAALRAQGGEDSAIEIRNGTVVLTVKDNRDNKAPLASADGGIIVTGGTVNLGPNPPAITALSPASGSPAGGEQVTLTGTSLTGATDVRIGGTPAADITSGEEGTTLTFTAPPGSLGAQDVFVLTPDGSYTLPDAYTYTAAHAITVTGTPASGGAPTANPSSAVMSAQVTLQANPNTDWRFDGWNSESPDVSFADNLAETTTFTMPDHAVEITADYTYIGGGGGGGGGGSSYASRTLTDKPTGVRVKGGSIHEDARLTVEAGALHRTGDAGCGLLGTAQGAGQVLSLYDVSLTRGFRGSVTVSLPVEDRDGQTLTVAHCVGGGLTLSDVRVEDGMAAVTVSELSPFAVLDGVYTLEELAAPVVVNPFTDVKESDWFCDAVLYVYGRGLMTGTGAAAFSPQAAVTRAQLPVILYRLEGSPALTGQSPFDDVGPGQWYTDGVTWAAGAGIVAGRDPQTFAPLEPVTREQLAVMLYRHAQYQQWDVSASDGLAAFSDAGEVSDWAREAVGWAVGAGLMEGDAGRLSPQAGATRAQLAQLLMRLLEQYAPQAAPVGGG